MIGRLSAIPPLALAGLVAGPAAAADSAKPASAAKAALRYRPRRPPPPPRSSPAAASGAPKPISRKCRRDQRRIHYTGGKTANPTLRGSQQRHHRHAEAVRVTYDPARVSYRQLVDHFWTTIDPTVKDRQFW